MTKKVALLQMADEGPTHSTRLMLESVGYKVYLPNKVLREELKRIGCDTVLAPSDLEKDMGYLRVTMPELGIEALDNKRVDLFCDVKAHRCYQYLVKRWPSMKDKILWTRINGSKPEHVITAKGFDCGDEEDPPCPVLTPNMWYSDPGPWKDKSYVMWPPFYRFDEYFDQLGRCTKPEEWTDPICLIHNVYGWGYGLLANELMKPSVNLKIYGRSSPHGVLQHEAVPVVLKFAKCMVHLKSNDAPGYALYETMSAACPIICSRRLIWRSKMQDLLIPGETCLVFDRETHDALTQEDVKECMREIKSHLKSLSDPTENQRIGMNGYKRLKEIMWSEKKKEDVESLRAFMERMFG